MADYRFSVLITASPMTCEEILDATDALGAAGCTDASIRGHAEGMELLFDRKAASFQVAVSSAIAEVESAGYRVRRVSRYNGASHYNLTTDVGGVADERL